MRRADDINNLARFFFFLRRKRRVRSRLCAATASEAEMWRALVPNATAEGHRGDGLAVSRAVANRRSINLPVDRSAIGGIPQFFSAQCDHEREREFLI